MKEIASTLFLSLFVLARSQTIDYNGVLSGPTWVHLARKCGDDTAGFVLYPPVPACDSVLWNYFLDDIDATAMPGIRFDRCDVFRRVFHDLQDRFVRKYNWPGPVRGDCSLSGSQELMEYKCVVVPYCNLAFASKKRTSNPNKHQVGDFTVYPPGTEVRDEPPYRRNTKTVVKRGNCTVPICDGSNQEYYRNYEQAFSYVDNCDIDVHNSNCEIITMPECNLTETQFSLLSLTAATDPQFQNMNTETLRYMCLGIAGGINQEDVRPIDEEAYSENAQKDAWNVTSELFKGLMTVLLTEQRKLIVSDLNKTRGIELLDREVRDTEDLARNNSKGVLPIPYKEAIVSHEKWYYYAFAIWLVVLSVILFLMCCGACLGGGFAGRREYYSRKGQAGGQPNAGFDETSEYIN